MTASVALAPSRFDGAFERLADWAGPLVVKEIRAGLRSRAFALAFGLMLLAGFTVMMVSAAVSWSGVDAPKGPEAFVGTTAAFALFGHVLMPFIAYRAMVREREDETWVLLVLTGLGTDGIVRGKRLSAWAQLGLGAAATAPFMLLSYLLSGIGLVNVVLGVQWNLAVATFLTTVALGLAAQSESRLERTAGHFVMLGLSALFVAISMGVSAALAFNGERFLREGEVIGLLLGVPLFLLGLSWCIQPAAAAALALDSEAKSHPARVRVVVVVTVGVIVSGALSVVLGAEKGFLIAPAILVALVLLVVGFFAFSERHGYPNRVAHDGARRPGAFRSALATVGLLAVSAVVFGTLGLAHPRTSVAAIAGPAFVSLYLSLGFLVGRYTALRKLGSRVATRVGFFIATGAGIVLPPVLALIDHQRPDRGPAWLINPLFGMVRFLDHGGLEGEALVLAALSVLVTFVALLTMSGEDGARTHE